MNGGDDYVRRAYRLGAEAVARVIDRPWLNPRPLAERADPDADLARARDRGRSHLGRLATRQVVVLPQLKRAIGRLAITSTPRSGDTRREV